MAWCRSGAPGQRLVGHDWQADHGIIAQRSDGFQAHIRARGTAHSSFCSSNKAPINRVTAASWGNADDLATGLDLAVEKFEGIGGVQLGVMLGWEAHTGQHIPRVRVVCRKATFAPSTTSARADPTSASTLSGSAASVRSKKPRACVTLSGLRPLLSRGQISIQHQCAFTVGDALRRAVGGDLDPAHLLVHRQLQLDHDLALGFARPLRLCPLLAPQAGPTLSSRPAVQQCDKAVLIAIFRPVLGRLSLRRGASATHRGRADRSRRCGHPPHGDRRSRAASSRRSGQGHSRHCPGHGLR